MTRILTDLAVDAPIRQDARYRFGASDRQYIDNQIRGVMQHLVDTIIRGHHATWVRLSGASDGVEIGHVVCSASLPGDEVTVTKVSDVSLASSLSTLGIVISSATPGGYVLVAFGGYLPPSITGLARNAKGFVRVNTGTARCERVETLSGEDFGIGVVDDAGFLSIQVGVIQGAEVPDGAENDLIGLDASGGLQNVQPADMQAGDMIVYDGSAWVKISADGVPDGWVLTKVSGMPAWAASSGGSIYDPDVLSPTARWNGFSGAPWVGSGTAGGSSLEETTYPPSVGPSLNGHATALFDGGTLTNDVLVSTQGMGDLFGSGLVCGIMLVFVHSISADSPTPSANDALISSATSGRFHLYLRSSGSVNMCLYDNTNADVICTAPFTPGEWVAVHWRHTGTHIQVGTNGTWGTAVACGLSNAGNAAYPLALGRNLAETMFTEMAVAELIFFDTGYSDDDFNAVISYFNAYYALSL